MVRTDRSLGAPHTTSPAYAERDGRQVDFIVYCYERLSIDCCWQPKGAIAPHAIVLASTADFSCQRHVNERTSFLECGARRMWADVSEFQG
jgi:hypothetical protein